MYSELLTINLKWLLSALIGLLSIYLIHFYIKVYRLPRGPFPYPFVGNLLLFRNTNEMQFITIAKLKKTYGPVYTVWLATKPFVIVNDFEMIKEAFNSKDNEFSGRPDAVVGQMLTQGKGHDIGFSDYGPVWINLKKIASSAIRNLETSEKLSQLSAENVDDIVSLIKKKEGINNPFDPLDYIYLMIFNIIAVSSFGKRYSIEDPEYIKIKYYLQEFTKTFGPLALIDFIPITKPFLYAKYKEAEKKMHTLSTIFQEKFREHLKSYKKGVIRDFCDALIEAKEETIGEERDSAQYFTDYNLSFANFDLFFGGTDSTNYTMRWITLFMANNTEMQIKMRKEVERVVGDRMPSHDDMKSCDFVIAFILESMRFRPVAPFAVMHKAMCDANIGKHYISKGASVSSFTWNIHHDPHYWPKPELFDPNRFIASDGKVVNTRNMPFLPFGVGRRYCLGVKLAMTDMFLITARFLQSTKPYLIALPDGDGSANLDPNPEMLFVNSPKPYKILLKSI